MKTDITRRAFLKGAAVSAVSVAALGLFSAASAGEGAPPASASTGSEGDSSDPLAAAMAAAAADGRVFGYSGPGDWLGEAPGITDFAYELSCDVCVVGSGHSGTQAALAAAECGAKVITIEKQDEDIFAYYGEDFAAYNCKLQLDAGFPEYDLGEVVDEYVTRSGGRSDPEIVRQFVANSGPAMDHMLEVAAEMGVDPRAYTYDNTPEGWLIIQANMDYDKIKAGNDIYDCLNLTNYPLQPGTKTWASTCQFMGVYNDEPIQGVAANSVLPLIQHACIDKAKTLGAEWYFGTSGVELIQNEDGDVVGVVAQDADGKYVKINTTKGVVMAGGDYAANYEMCWALLNEYMERNERKGGLRESFFSFMGGRTGESVKMMCWAGGFVEPAPRGTMILGGGPGGPWGSNAMLWLNKNGERFTNEGNLTAAQTATSRQPTGLGCLVTDQKWMQSVCNSGIEHGGPNAGRPQYYQDMLDDMAVIVPGPDGGKVKNCTIAERGYSTVIAANTLEELATYLGYEEEAIPTLVASIAHYNELCYAGSDTDYGKRACAMVPVDEPPYYGVRTTLNSRASGPSMVTMSGVMTDKSLNVIDINGNAIKGLFTCGNSLGGRYGTGYCTPSAGNSIGFAGTHGRVAGLNICK